jgi:hypothetical protein
MTDRLPSSASRRLASRHGSAMVLVLACMAVAAAIAATMLRAATSAHRGLRTERDLRLVECLLEAAVRMAQARAAAAEAIDKEILLPADDLAGSGSARITFARGPATSQPSIRIVVEYPLEGPLTIRRSRSVIPASNPSVTPEESRP